MSKQLSIPQARVLTALAQGDTLVCIWRYPHGRYCYLSLSDAGPDIRTQTFDALLNRRYVSIRERSRSGATYYGITEAGRAALAEFTAGISS